MSDFRYFRPVEGRVVQRYGNADSFIGARRTPDGFEIDPTRVVAIPEDEYRRFKREYDAAVRRKDLVAATRDEFDEFQSSRSQAVVEPVVEEVVDDARESKGGGRRRSSSK